MASASRVLVSRAMGLAKLANTNIKLYSTASPATYEFIKTEKVGAKNNVLLITLNRPKALNALCDKLVCEINDVLDKHESDANVGAVSSQINNLLLVCFFMFDA
ncbi:probable enoyl-CoA hydratase, mitochondrial [Ctenocephalides felis]|uniref:probable enoyl-CoA hydratase, mitochondrial n=1 Tax=Ctenocephalides felis TaxID=7515 RepID=UPI000E6E1192|nr:probable enoyl-CoA hydratase, mitochondrial [Ctenocephalides felis]